MAGAERGEASCRIPGPTPRRAGGPHPTGSPSAWPGSASPAEGGGRHRSVSLQVESVVGLSTEGSALPPAEPSIPLRGGYPEPGHGSSRAV